MNSNFSPITRFFCFCSGANLKVLNEECPSEIGKYAAIGATVLFTGLFAVISSSYALDRVFLLEENGWWYALGFGLLWGLMIFNLDRYIVMSMRKEGNISREFLYALPRIAIAILIALVISKPLEVKLFQDPIAKHLAEKAIDWRTGQLSSVDEMSGKTKNETKLVAQNTEVDSLIREVRSGEPVSVEFKELLTELDEAEEDYDQKEKYYRPKINNLSWKASNLKKSNLEYRTDTVTGKTIEYLPPEIQRQYNTWIATRNSHINTINKAKKLVEDFTSQINDERKTYRQWVEQEILPTAKSEADSLGKEVARSNVEYKKWEGFVDNSNRGEVANTFIEQVKALGDISLETWSTMWWTKWLITLLFFVIETAPIFVKLISKRGLYDEAISAKHELELAERIENNNLEFAQQQEVRKSKRSLIKKGVSRYEHVKSSELETMGPEELVKFFREINQFNLNDGGSNGQERNEYMNTEQPASSTS